MNTPTKANGGIRSLDQLDMRVRIMQEALERIIQCPNVEECHMDYWSEQQLQSHAAEAAMQMQKIAQDALAHIEKAHVPLADGGRDAERK